jgi:ketol-acid reductoisomerase
MTPYKESIFRELEKVLAKAAPEQIERLLNDIAQGKFTETAQTRAGANDNHCNVTGINELADKRRGETVHVKDRSSRNHGAQLSAAARDVRRAGYSS